MVGRTSLLSRGLRVVSAAAHGIALAVLGGRAFSAQDNSLTSRVYENWPRYRAQVRLAVTRSDIERSTKWTAQTD